MSETKTTVYPIEKGALTDVPIYDNHKRAKNWLAVVTSDPGSPGGLKRAFMRQANGSYYYFVEGIKPGDFLEFGADYYTGGGKKKADRVYAKVLSVSESALELEELADRPF